MTMPIHTEQDLTHYLEMKLPWPAMSPNMNPIEHIWDCMDRQLQCLVNSPDTLHQFERNLHSRHPHPH